jgi:hypothetical protein
MAGWLEGLPAQARQSCSAQGHQARQQSWRECGRHGGEGDRDGDQDANAGGQVQAGQGGQPGGHRKAGQPQVRDPILAEMGVTPPRFGQPQVRGLGLAAHTVTRSLSCS